MKCARCLGIGWLDYTASLRWHGGAQETDSVLDLCSLCYGSGFEGGTVSFCGCSLEPGAWGIGGWHLRRRTVQELLWWACVDRARTDAQDMRSLRAYSAGTARPHDVNAVERLRAEVWRSESVMILAAASHPWAVEPCPRYRQAASAKATTEKQNGRMSELNF